MRVFKTFISTLFFLQENNYNINKNVNLVHRVFSRKTIMHKSLAQNSLPIWFWNTSRRIIKDWIVSSARLSLRYKWTSLIDLNRRKWLLFSEEGIMQFRPFTSSRGERALAAFGALEFIFHHICRMLFEVWKSYLHKVGAVRSNAVLAAHGTEFEYFHECIHFIL